MKFKNNFKRFFTLDRHHDAGFTLVELIVVIAILAILAGITVPAYSAYIEKSKKSVDLQLIAAVNTAFTAAAAENGKSVAQLAGSTLAIGDNGAVGALTVNMAATFAARTGGDDVAAAIQSDFAYYYDAANNGAFKTISNTTLTSGVDGFSLPGDEGSEGGNGGKFATIFNEVKESVSAQITALNNSVFGTMGSATMLEKVDSVTGIAAELAGKSSSFKGMLNGNVSTLAAIMGYDLTNADEKTEFLAYYNGMIADKAAEMNPENPDAAKNAATNEILSNLAVLAAAKNTTETSDVLLGQLQEGISSTEIKNMLQGTNGSQDALSKSAMMYAMYTAYANGLPDTEGWTDSNGKTKAEILANTNDVSTFMTAMDTDPGFVTYLQNNDGKAKQDLEGYLGALAIINASAGTEDKSVITDLLLNGYGGEDLSAGLNGLLGK